MPNHPLSTVLRHIRAVAVPESTRELSDGQLLEQFAARANGPAFAELVRRYGRLVWGVCRNVLGNDHDADDAFQATFLVLVRQAASVRKAAALSSWLHGVAYRVAMKAKRGAARRRAHERQAPQPPQARPVSESAWRDLQAALDEEVHGLPDRLRVPFVLCFLEGKGPADVAGQLGWKVSTVRTRLSQARQELLLRLARRGVSLSAALCAATLCREAAGAALPTALATMTVRAALAEAAGKPGAVSPHLAGLIEGGLRPMALSNAKTIVTLVLALGLACTGAGLWAGGPFGTDPRSADAGKARAAQGPGAESAPQVPKPANTAQDDDKKITVSGRVLDPDGKPVRAARVLVLDRPAGATRAREGFSLDLAGETETDAQGRFQLRVRPPGGQPPPSPIHPLPLIFVRADGYGPGVQAVTANASKGAMVIRLPREQVLRARFVDDTNGKPVKDLVVKVAFVTNPGGIVAPPAQAPRAWFPATKTDAQGRLVLRGIGTGQLAIVEWRDPRFRSQRLELWKTEAQQGGEEVVHKLEPPPPEFITGRVAFKDTGKPAAGVTVRTRGSKTKTDLQGRFRLKTDWPPPESAPFSGGPVNAWVEADAPAGTGYLGGLAHVGPGRFPRRDGTLGPWEMEEFRIALPRGVRVQGRVLEAGTNKGIPRASVSFGGYQATSGPDGAFSLTTAGGAGHLVVTAAADYAPVEAKVPQGRLIAHAVVPVDLKEGTDAKPVQISLRRGVGVKGKLAGPDGQPVQGAVLISRLMINHAMNVLVQSPSPVPSVPVAADFELRGCDPEKPYPVIFFQEQKGWGALVQVSGKQAGKPLNVRLQPCGAARARFLTAEGRPIAGRGTAAHLLVVLAAGDTAFWGGFIEHSNTRKDWHTDAEGRITWRELVPGVTYRVNNREFTVKSGEVLDLGDLK
jgi:RNA polymerase sigma factor (sigma-70 family)